MNRYTQQCSLRVAIIWLFGSAVLAGESDWQQVKTYQYGQDLRPLLAVEREVYKSLASPEGRKQVAARLVELMADNQATPAARQFAGWELWVVGTEADVPALAKLLDDPVVADWAREALEMIPGEKSGAALRAALGRLKGRTLVGAINSLGKRRDAKSVEALGRLTTDKDAEVAAAACSALGSIDTPEALIELIKATVVPTTGRLSETTKETPLVLHRDPARQAALVGALNAAGGQLVDKALTMLASDDPDAQAIAAAKLVRIAYKEETAKDLIQWLRRLAPPGRALLLGVLAERGIKEAAPEAEAALNAPELPLRLAGIRALAFIGDAKHVPLLASGLGAAEPMIDEASRDSLNRLAAPGVDEALVTALTSADATRRVSIIELLAWRKCAAAVPVLLGQATRAEPAVGDAAILAIRALATPKYIPAMIKVIVAAKPGSQRDEMEKAVVAICGQIADAQRRADAALEAYAAGGNADRTALLPLLGRLGGPRALAAIREAMKSQEPEIREAAIRGLCNWPDASAAPELLELARQSDKKYSVWALRAYIRVITSVGSGRDLETLALLKQAMPLATEKAERQLILNRARAVRTIETLRWLLPYVDDPELCDAACETIVDLARQRFLRTPNQQEFNAALKKVIATCKAPAVTDTARTLAAGIGWD